MNYVYAVEGGKVVRRQVEVGRSTTSSLEITNGLETGTRLALDAYQRGLADFGEAEKDAEAILTEKSTAADKE